MSRRFSVLPEKLEEAVLQERLRAIRLLALDVDGVLTDGRIVYGNYGDELKFFDVQDGFGLYLLRRAGIRTAFITAKKSTVVSRRAKENHVDKVYQNARDKLKVYGKMKRHFRVKDEEICFMGDDLIDLPIMVRAGVAISAPNAVEAVRERSHYLTKSLGGRGAVREVVDMILKSQQKLESLIQEYQAFQAPS